MVHRTLEWQSSIGALYKLSIDSFMKLALMTFIGYFCNHVLLSNKHVHVFYTELTCVPKLVEIGKKIQRN